VGTGPPDTLRVQTADNVSLGYSTAGVGSRMAAQLIDSTVALALVFVALVAAGGLVSRASTAQGLAWGAGAAAAFAGFVYFGYFLVYEAVTGGRTLAAQVGTAVYFLFFFLMPWYSKMDTTRPEPQRVTWK